MGGHICFCLFFVAIAFAAPHHGHPSSRKIRRAHAATSAHSHSARHQQSSLAKAVRFAADAPQADAVHDLEQPRTESEDDEHWVPNPEDMVGSGQFNCRFDGGECVAEADCRDPNLDPDIHVDLPERFYPKSITIGNPGCTDQVCCKKRGGAGFVSPLAVPYDTGADLVRELWEDPVLTRVRPNSKRQAFLDILKYFMGDLGPVFDRQQVIFQSGTASYIYGCRAAPQDGLDKWRAFDTDADFWVMRKQTDFRLMRRGNVRGRAQASVAAPGGEHVNVNSPYLSVDDNSVTDIDPMRIDNSIAHKYKLGGCTDRADMSGCHWTILRMEILTDGSGKMWATSLNKNQVDEELFGGDDPPGRFAWGAQVQNARGGHFSHGLPVTFTFHAQDVMNSLYNQKFRAAPLRAVQVAAEKTGKKFWRKPNNTPQYHETDVYTLQGAYVTGYLDTMEEAYAPGGHEVVNGVKVVSCAVLAKMKRRFYIESSEGRRIANNPKKNYSKGVNDLADLRCVCARCGGAGQSGHDSCAGVDALRDPTPFVEGRQPRDMFDQSLAAQA